jgi:hypothetical protein
LSFSQLWLGIVFLLVAFYSPVMFGHQSGTEG